MNEIVKARVIDGLRLAFGQDEALKLWEAISPEGDMVERVALQLFLVEVEMSDTWTEEDERVTGLCFLYAEKYVEALMARRAARR